MPNASHEKNNKNRTGKKTAETRQAPHPMNLVAPHLMVELRSAGFIEICGDLDEVRLGLQVDVPSLLYNFKPQRGSGI